MSKVKKEEEEKIRYGTVSLPLPLINKIHGKIKGTGMPSVSAYVAFVLRNILSSKPNEREIKELKSKLKNLGYE